MRCERGIVYAEFLISFSLFFTLFLGSVQLAFLAQARLVVLHAAVTAARTAVITIDDDPAFYDGEERKKLASSGGSGEQSGQTDLALGFLGAGESDVPSAQGMQSEGGDRLQRIRNAAYVPLGILAPSPAHLGQLIRLGGLTGSDAEADNLRDAIGDAPLLRFLGGFGVYGRVAAAVTFPTGPGADELRALDTDSFPDDAPVTVRITYLYPCGVPIARALVCDSILDMTGLPAALRATLEGLEHPSVESIQAAVDAWRTEYPRAWREFRRNQGELEHAEWAVLQLALIAQPGAKFAVIRAEATLPNQGVAYKYKSELEGGG